MAPAVSPPGIKEATERSASTWQNDLQALFHHAKDRFPDVVWEVQAEDENTAAVDEVWGHKAVIYARAPPTFQARYFSFRPAPVASPMPYSSSPLGTLPAQSSVSLSLGLDSSSISRSPSPLRTTSPVPSTQPGSLLRLPISINPILFSNELEYLYTGKGLGEAFEFLFDTSESRDDGDADDNRVDKLRKDLVFMWRSRLYSDVRIALSGTFSSMTHENATAIFSSHRFMLVSRSPYFHSQLLTWGISSKGNEPCTLTLPSPPFTPASLHFTLGFIYTGTLVFSHRTYDLDTAFHIMRSATYLALDSLYDEIQARIVQEMMHGLFHAFLEFAEYERVTGGKWGTGGCRCRQCARRAPRVLEFALSDDVKNPHLERGARRALVGLYGEGWCISEFASLPQKTRDGLLKGLAKRTTPMNVFPLLFATQHALHKLDSIIDAWAEIPREMISSARKTIDETLCSQPEESFEQPEWLELMEDDGVNFDDGERVGWIMDSIRRGLNEKHAGILYQTIVSSILLRPHATETDATMLSSTSPIREQVEETRMYILRWMRKRWMGIRQESGFDNLEGWALKEISHEIEVAPEDLLNPSPQVHLKGVPTRSGLRATLNKTDVDSDTTSMHSLRASVLSRSVGRHATPSRQDQVVASSGASVRSVARSTISRAPRIRPSDAHKSHGVAAGSRPDSKLTSDSASVSSFASRSTVVVSDRPPGNVSESRMNAHRSSSSRLTTSSIHTKPKSPLPLLTSPQSRSRLIGSSVNNLRIPSVSSRPTSSLSTTSDASTTFKTANSTPTTASRSRRTSTASTKSNGSVRTAGPPKVTRPRFPSGVSSTSTISVAAKTKRIQAVPSTRTESAGSTTRKSFSSVAARPTSSTASLKVPQAAKRKTVVEKENAAPSPEILSPSIQLQDEDKSKEIEQPAIESNDEVPSPSPMVLSLSRRGSSDTVTTSMQVIEKSPVDQESPLVPRGATLDIGIPCIISSKRKRFRAFARYIGEVEGEFGPWVGVEVPVNDDWTGDHLEGRQWNDGSWGGIRYFDIGGGSEWDFGDERAARRRRLDGLAGSMRSKGLKREGDHLSMGRTKRLRSSSPTASEASTSESRGLFVRPQQVLYVFDVGADL